MRLFASLTNGCRRVRARPRNIRGHTMSALVEFPPELYDPRAFASLTVTSEFRLETALAMMWFSQLAYETGQPDTIKHAQDIWGFDDIRKFGKHIVFQPKADKPLERFSLDTRGV